MSNAVVDRNLLFGILALQMDFISYKALIDALRNWSTHRDKSLGQILVERGGLSAARRELLEPLVDEHVRQHNDDPAASLAALSSLSESTVDWKQIQDPEIQDSLAARQAVRDAAATDGDPQRRSDRASPGTERFRVLRPHARGGIGEVFLAFDNELNREVALKEIQSRHRRDESHRERFVREAEVTGGLEHPGIVPVYSLGHHADGRPFYAMRFIRGDSLQEAIERFHAGPQPAIPEVPDNINSPTVIGEAPPVPADNTAPTRHRVTPREQFGSIEFRKLLGRFIDVCHAIEYAHSRGVLHRDLKPGNIMLGKYGETLVVDWGLAKIAGNSDRITNTEEATLVPSSGSSLEQTADGSVIGTPAYMSPEQAAGKLEQLGTATDVYSLGATLYHLLTGRAPFDKLRLKQLLAAVRKGEFPHPLEINPYVPRALAAICLKSMALRPEDRYASTAEIAEDVEHWLADEPVSACPDSAIAGMGRWFRKHRAWALSGTAALAGIAVVATIAAVWINWQKDLIARQERAATDLSRRNEALAADKTRLATLESAARQKSDRNAAAAIRQTKLARRHLYSAHLNLVQNTWEDARIGEMMARLQSWRPPQKPSIPDSNADTPRDPIPGTEEDLRGFEWRYWDRTVNAWLMNLREASASHAMAFRADGTQLISGGQGPLRVWNLVKGQLERTIDRHTSVTACLAVTADGQQIATATADGTVRVFDASTGQQTQIFDQDIKTRPGGVFFTPALAFSPDGERLASVRYGALVKVWNVTTGKELLSLKTGDNPGVNFVTFSPDGQTLVVAVGTLVQLRNAQTGQEIRTLTGHTGIVSTLAFRPDGRTLVSASRFNALLEPDVEVKEWDLATGRESGAWKKRNRNSEFATMMTFSPDGKRLAAAVNQEITVWDVSSSQEVLTLKGHPARVHGLAFSPNGTCLASSADDRTLKLWDAREGQEPTTLAAETYLFGSPTFNSVAFSPDGTQLAMCGDTLTVKIWNTVTRQEVFTLKGHKNRVVSLAFSPDGTRLATGSSDQTVKIWDPKTGRELRTLTGHAGGVTSVAFSPGGDRVASASYDQTVKIWDPETGTELVSWNGKHGIILSVAYHPKAQEVATSGQDQIVRTWDASTGQVIHSFSGHSQVVPSLTYDSEGRRLASASLDQTLKIWDATLGREILTLRGHTQGVTSVAFAPDGERLASGSDDRTVKVWDPISGQETLTLKGHSEEIRNVTFDRDGTRLASVGNNYLVKIWDARPRTPALIDEQRAVSLIWTLSDRGLSKADLLNSISSDFSLPLAVRDRATSLAGPFADLSEQQAVELVRDLKSQCTTRTQVLVAIRHSRSISEGVRLRATEIANALPENLQQ